MPAHWTNRLSFIITTSAFAVGLGNIWRFPYIVGEGGGGAFLLVYLGLILLVGIPILLTEIALGRMSQSLPLTGFGKLGKKAAWNGVGWLGVGANLLIMGYYVMILAWIVIYGWDSFLGKISRLETGNLTAHFDAVASNTGLVLAVVAGILVVSGLIAIRGLHQGLERHSRWMMILLILLLIGLAGWAATLEGAAEGYRWYLTPDFSKINFQVVLSALGQLFFSIGVGMAIAFAFGSYTGEKENIVTSTAWIVLIDTLFAVISGLMIFPALFTFQIPPDSGPNLVFIAMTSVFGRLSNGAVLGGLFFLLLFLAGFTSLIASIQGLKDSLGEKFKLSSGMSLAWVLGIIGLVAVPATLSYVEDPQLVLGLTAFEFLDFLTNTVMLPLGGLLIILFGAYIVGFQRLREEVSKGAEGIRIGAFWGFMIKVVIPGSVAVILIYYIVQ